jgi:hypothetical protein
MWPDRLGRIGRLAGAGENLSKHKWRQMTMLSGGRRVRPGIARECVV